MKLLLMALFLLFITVNFSYSDCNDGVTEMIKNNGNLKESDRKRLMSECKELDKFLSKVDLHPEKAYILNTGDFTCYERRDYIELFNTVMDQGGEYNWNQVEGFKSCGIIQSPIVVKVVQNNVGDQIVKIHRPDKYVEYYWYEEWVHKSSLKPYSDFKNMKIK